MEVQKVNDCVFCKIVAGDLPCYKVYEDADHLAFLSIAPLNPGHTLVIPKRHYRWVWDVENIGGYYELVGKIARAMKIALETDYVVSLVFGEEVPHAHVWLVPRYADDGHGDAIDLSLVRSISADEMSEIAAKINKILKI